MPTWENSGCGKEDQRQEAWLGLNQWGLASDKVRKMDERREMGNEKMAELLKEI